MYEKGRELAGDGNERQEMKFTGSKEEKRDRLEGISLTMGMCPVM